MKLVEPPSCRSAASTIVFIGRNRKGNWVAREQNGLFGGLFVSRAQAVKYALFENGNHPETIVDLPREIEVDFTGPFPQAAGTSGTEQYSYEIPIILCCEQSRFQMAL